MRPKIATVEHTFLMVLEEMGIIDHAVALKRQIERSGGTVRHVALGDQQLPTWAARHFPSADGLSEVEALGQISSFTAVWLSRPYERARAGQWKKLWERIPVVYSGYGLPLTVLDRHIHESEFFDFCSYIMAGSPSEKDSYEKIRKTTRAVEFTGDPLLFEIARDHQDERSKSKVRTILWAPHWSKKVAGSRGFYNWRWTLGPLFVFLRKNPQVSLIVRGHPFLKFQDATSGPGKKVRGLLSLPNVSLSKESMATDIGRSDALITDGVSIIAYFGVASKPVAVVKHPRLAPPFSVEGMAIVESMSALESRRQITRWLSKVTADPGPFLSKARDSRKLILLGFPMLVKSPGQHLMDRFS